MSADMNKATARAMEAAKPIVDYFYRAFESDFEARDKALLDFTSRALVAFATSEQAELLAALRDLYDIACCYDLLICHPAVDRARAALAKAEERR